MTGNPGFADAATVLQLTEEEQQRLLDLQRGIEVVRIAQALAVGFPGDRAAKWLRAPNRAFGSRPALDLLLSDDVDDVLQLRRYSEYWAYNGW